MVPRTHGPWQRRPMERHNEWGPSIWDGTVELSFRTRQPSRKAPTVECGPVQLWLTERRCRGRVRIRRSRRRRKKKNRRADRYCLGFLSYAFAQDCSARLSGVRAGLRNGKKKKRLACGTRQGSRFAFPHDYIRMELRVASYDQ